MIKKKKQITDPKTTSVLTTILVFVIILYALWVLRFIFLGALLGFILYSVLYKIHRSISKSTKSTSLGIIGSMLVLVSFFGVCGAVITFLVFDLGGQLREVLSSFSSLVPQDIISIVQTLDLESTITYVQENFGGIKDRFGQIASGVTQFFSVVTFALVFVLVFLVQPSWIKKIGKKLESISGKKISSLTVETRGLLYTWFWQQAKVGVIVAIIIFVYMSGLQLISGEDVSNIWIISSLGFLGEFFPLVGPLVSWIPVGAASFGISSTAGIVSVIFFFVLQIVEGYVLIPKIVGSKLRMPTTWSIVLLLVGGSLFGILGVILSLPIGALIYRKLR